MGTFKKYKILIIFSVAIINVNHFKKKFEDQERRRRNEQKKETNIFKKIYIFFKEKYETKSKTSISGDVLFTNTAAMHDRYVQNQPISTQLALWLWTTNKIANRYQVYKREIIQIHIQLSNDQFG